MKPQNQRRNNLDLEQTLIECSMSSTSTASNYYQGRDNSNCDMEMEECLLPIYIFRQAGYEIDFDKFKIPYYVAGQGKYPTLHFLDIKLRNGESLSADNCDVKESLLTIQEKCAEIRAQKQRVLMV